MRIAVSQLTINCAKVICSLVPTDNVALNNYVSSIANAMDIQVFDVVNLIKRCLDPKSPALYDGQHDLAEWYDNNIQLPRLFLATLDHLNLVAVPATILHEHNIDDAMFHETVSNKHNSYVATQRVTFGL